MSHLRTGAYDEYILVLMAILVTLTGCGLVSNDAGGHSSSLPLGCQRQGSVSFTMGENQAHTVCRINVTYSNGSSVETRPIVEVVLYDSVGNTIERRFIYFDPILPGKMQEKENLFYGPNICSVKRLFIPTATDANNLDVDNICGVSRMEYSVQ